MTGGLKGNSTAARLAPAGRGQELQILRELLDDAFRGQQEVVLIAGASGVGKTALTDAVQAIARGRGARVVSADFGEGDEVDATVLRKALGHLGRLIACDSVDEREQQRRAILRALGSYAGLARVIPEFEQLLCDIPDSGPPDSAHAAARLVELTVGLLRALATPATPLVLVLDNLHRAEALAIRLVDAIIHAIDLSGLLVLAAFRDDALGTSNPLATSLPRWAGLIPRPALVRLENLTAEGVVALLAQSVGLTAREGAALGALILPHTLGNPADTLDMLAGLLDEERLRRVGPSWMWDPQEVSDYLSRTTPSQALAARLGRLAEGPRTVLQIVACLQPGADLATVRAVTRLDAADFEAAVTLLEAAQLISEMEGPNPALRTCHPRIARAAHALVPVEQAGSFHLELARRLDAAGALALAAEQYAAGADAIGDAQESRHAASILRGTAATGRPAGERAKGFRMLQAAMRLLQHAAGQGDPSDAGALAACEIEYHGSLVAVGRLEEADAVYARIESRTGDPLKLVDAACVQISSLCNRGLTAKALDLGFDLLHDFGIHAPTAAQSAEDLALPIRRLRIWVDGFDLRRECARPANTSPRVHAAAKLLLALQAPAIFRGPQHVARLVSEAQSLWERFGPFPALAATMGRAGLLTVALEQDFRTGYQAVRHLLEMCEARGWEPADSQVRYIFSVACSHWFEPLERKLRESERAREGLLTVGDFRNACFAYRNAAVCLLDCDSLQRYADEIDAALVLARRSQHTQAVTLCKLDAMLVQSLRGRPPGPPAAGTRADDEGAGLGTTEARFAENRAIRNAICCAILADPDGLAVHVRSAPQVPWASHAFYSQAWNRWLQGLSCAWDVQRNASTDPVLRRDYLAELDRSIDWLQQRAIDAPFNFRHMQLHLIAERSWALGELEAAAQAFDHAMESAEINRRPWHLALIVERAGRLHLANGLQHQGVSLLCESQALYGRWGALAKVEQLQREIGTGGWDAAAFTAQDDFHVEGVDSLAVLRATQTLGLERTTVGLKARVEELLRGITGASRVLMVLWDDDATDWVVTGMDSAGRSRKIPVDATPPILPLSAFRYAERTLVPLLVEDAVMDDRFARDAYFVDRERCSLLLVPVLRRGAARAMLVLQSPASPGAFIRARLDAVMMIAGQLTVTLESVQLYERLERKVSEQTEALRDAQSRVVEEARRAGMAHIATNVLHNVGNVLTSVNVSTHLLATQVRQSRAARVADLAQLLADAPQQRLTLFAEGGKGRLLPVYFRQLANALEVERAEMLAELERLAGSVDHIKTVVAMQQSYAGANGVRMKGNIVLLVEDALRILDDTLQRNGVRVERDFQEVPTTELDKARVMQVLVNLIENARQAMEGIPGQRALRICVAQDAAGLRVSVGDSGRGLARDDLNKIFSHGFTTLAGGQGFGLHSCSVAAREMGGTLSVQSDGPGCGSTFTLLLPA